MNTLEVGGPVTGSSYTRTMRVMPSFVDAEELARELLEPLANRWAHVRAVAARADGLTPAIAGEDDRQLLVVAAWWHDLGVGWRSASPSRTPPCARWPRRPA